MRKNFRSDISIRESFYDYDQSGERIQSLVPENVRIEYFTPAYPRVRLVCSRNGDTFHNCSLSENGRVLVCNLALSRKSLGVGPLLKIVKHSVADSSFPYDFQNKEHIASTGIDLWGGPSDAGELESESVLSEVILRYGYSAYRLAVLDGFEGTEQEWLESLIGDEGKSAYQVAVDNGFDGTVAEWLASLVGAPGKSAYQVAVDNGFEGTEQEWLESLIGDEGKSAYQVAVDNGFEGTEEEWLLSLQGKSAYEIAVELGYEGTEEQWIASLRGDDGNPGTTPHIGQNGHWFIGATDTGVLAEGTDGVTPHIGDNGHWYIGDVDTGVIGEGHDGQDGVGFDDASTPAVTDGTFIITLSNGDIITVDLNHVHPEYYSKVVETSQPQGGFLPDVIYKLGTIAGSVTFALAAAESGNANHYFIMFETGSTAPTITWPSGLTWAAGGAPTIAASKHYEISIMDGIAAYLEV